VSAAGGRQAPIFTAAWDLNVWVQRHLGGGAELVARAAAQVSLDLLDALVLALKDIDRDEQLALADRELIRLRMRLRLAHETALLDERQLEFLLRLTDDIGRQLGGWQKSLARAS
jgi:hypothetical protein